jgi:ribosome biogenesis GTPase
LIATNIDTAFIVVAADRDFSVNRIQRYLAIVLESKIEPIVVLNKIDLVKPEECQELLQEIQGRIPDVPIVLASCENASGLEEIHKLLKPGKTYCLLGSSGVGKSSLLNKLSGEETMSTASISETSDRGKHTTTHRELILLSNGAMIIDNPGMREVGMTTTSSGIQEVFDEISDLAQNCKYGDCQHISEAGCAVLEALANGEIAQADYDNYMRLQKEQEHFQSSELERKQKGKALSKHIKNYYKSKDK